MAIGYFLRLGDKTTCGGRILTGDPTFIWYGVAGAREGDLVSCGKHPGIYRIQGGVYDVWDEGRRLAGTLDSISGCPCRSQLIPSITDCYQKESASAASPLFAPAAGVTQFAQSARREDEPEQHAQATRKKKRELTLTIGVFFDGTGNNADNTTASINACTGEHFGMDNADAMSAYFQCIELKRGYSGTAAGSHLGYYTNIHWLHTLYATGFPVNSDQGQNAIYIEGIGTETDEGDSVYGMATGKGNTGVVRKTDKAVAAMVAAIRDYLARPSETDVGLVKELQFDIFGFSRGAAAARHFVNRVSGQDNAIIAAIKSGLNGVEFSGTPGGKTRFLGIFDTVAAIGTPINGLNPHSADTGEVNIALRPGVAEKVFHITAQHECRFNFALNSVKPAWPELALPGVHSDIGGGYNPDEHEAWFLTRPQFETVPLSTPDTATRVYQQTSEQLAVMDTCPTIAPVLKAVEIEINAWHDDRMPADRYGTLQKRSGAALIMERPTRNDWSKVVLRVMIDAAQDAGVVFDPILPKDDHLSLRAELNSLCEKAIMMGRAARGGQSMTGFTTPEIYTLAEKYLHCSANWNSVIRDGQGMVTGAVKPAKLVTFTNRPDEHWQRTVYDMDGNKIWK
ncbi:phospholipase effector Tle1 domain-containing protein [Phytobacter sp. V91]|uniref:phospholipase effector Tle1 domain-containing protein n=1 Tax=Phytobacter sp. V91 TaxID=3369425 RepID=UPI003F63D2E5